MPSIEGEFARKRRMMSHAWPIVLRGGLLSPRGYPPLYALMIVSHRVAALRGAVPARRRARRERRCSSARAALYAVALALQLALLAAALLAGRLPLRPLLVARYYVLTTASVAAGLWDHLRHGTPAGWEPAGGHAMIAPRVRRRRRGGRARARVAGPARSRSSRSAWSPRATRSTASAASAATGASSTC